MRTITVKSLGASTFLLYLLILSILPTQLAAAPQLTRLTETLPGSPRHLNYLPKHDLLFASLVLQGSLLIHGAGNDTGWEVEYHPEWKSLHSIEISETQILSGDRFEGVRLIEKNGLNSKAYRQVELWEVSGIPTHLYLYNNLLMIASGASGLYAYDFPVLEGRVEAPVLRSRYPFVDYSKEIGFVEQGSVYLADNMDTGLQVLDYTDILRPVLVEQKKGDFVDSVSVTDQLVAIAWRRNGVEVYKREGRELKSLYRIALPSRGIMRLRRAAQVKFASDDTLIACWGAAGAGVYRTHVSGQEVQEVWVSPNEITDHLVCVEVLPRNRYLFGAQQGTLYLLQNN